ncbi:Asparagine synthetase 1 [Planctomyces sp. SH-PL14]|nr:asparagine synthase (glutamine-hydrolyzing) [Planctomyces sp. SH-PL14]AMV22027.1 Asparagine synthetase 1 [Planctomyces sp. SH-PL14]
MPLSIGTADGWGANTEWTERPERISGGPPRIDRANCAASADETGGGDHAVRVESGRAADYRYDPRGGIVKADVGRRWKLWTDQEIDRMCGIAGGSWTGRGERLSNETVRRMTDCIQHRGPDDEGAYFDTLPDGAGCALGFRRLSIIDLSTGHQPLANEDESVWIVFNGEIYNYRELRPDLEAKGHRFSTSTDTEVIVHLYEEYGLDCLQKLRGMFAFAIWDRAKERLFLARDRAGKKPLFYRHEPDRLTFGSELKTLLQIPGAPREVDPEAVDLFLTYQYVPHPRTILKGYSKLPPGHLALYERGTLSVRRYWFPPYSDAPPEQPLADPELANAACWSDDDWRNRLRSTLTEAVRLRMRSDVPIGAFLSGGVDSTIISGLMQSLSDRPIHTFSIGFPVKQFDEREYARTAAKHLGTNHHEYLVEPKALEMLPKLVWHYDEPFGDSSAIPTMYLSEVTRREVTVALSGDGGDELFAGYERYQAVALAGRLDVLPQWARGLFGAKLWQQIPSFGNQRSIVRRGKRFLQALGQSPQRRYLRWIGIFDDELRRDLYTPDFRRRLGGFDSGTFLLDAYTACPDRDFITQTTCTDVLSYLPCDILTKVDIASMAFSLEGRSPFLDHHVMELAARMPIHLKFAPGRGKIILQETFRDLLPPAIQTRKKMGFGVPLSVWFRDELRSLLRDTILSSQAAARGYFDMRSVERLVEEHESERWDHSYRLWNLLVFEEWHRQYIDGSAG